MRSQKGFTLIECLISMAILGIVAVGLFCALTMANRSNIINNEKTTAESLARSQMDYVQNQTYISSSLTPDYAEITNVPAGYTVETAANSLNAKNLASFTKDQGVQQIVVTVRSGSEVVKTLTDYKVNK